MPHIHNKIDFCSETFIVCKNTVLLRKHDKLKMWLSVGGHIELDEDPVEAAIREAKEEVGLDVVIADSENRLPIFIGDKKSIIPPQYINRHRISDSHEHIAFIYFGQVEIDELKLSEREITDECKWFTKEELEKNRYGISDDVQFYALKALENFLEKS